MNISTLIQSYRDLLAEMDEFTTLITPNQRLSAYLHQLHQGIHIERQNKVWSTPDILPLNTWLKRCWTNACLRDKKGQQLLLNKHQELMIWEHIIRTSPISEWLLQIEETALLAQSAYKLLQEWEVNIEDQRFAETEDTLTFKLWVNHFDKLGEENNWLTEANLTQILINDSHPKQLMPTTNSIVLIGFLQYWPQISRLVNWLEKNNMHIICHSPRTKFATSARIEFKTMEEEWINMAEWSKSQINIHPSRQIACIVPSLNRDKDKVLRVFKEVFAESQDSNSQFNITAGKPLSTYPLIKTALKILTGLRDFISYEALTYFFTNPYLGDAEKERIKRSVFCTRLVEENIRSMHLKNMLSAKKERLNLEKQCPLLYQRLINYYDSLSHCRQTKAYSHAEWIQHFNKWLTILGFPGEKTLNSEEYQLMEAWLNLLNQLTYLDHIKQKVTLSEATRYLYHMATQTVYQPQSPRAPVQIMGMLEAAAIPFDSMWVSGLNELNWPAPPNPHPLIPRSIQRELTMPHASAEKEYAYSDLMTQQLLQASNQCFFSHATEIDHMVLQPSPLLESIALISDLDLPSFESLAKKIYKSSLRENFYDDQVPVYASQELTGGTDILKQQAQCSFKAFSKYRLLIPEQEKISLGLRPKDRGIIIHKILELLWTELKTQQQLMRQTEEDLTQLIYQYIEKVLHDFTVYLPTNYLALEKERLYKLIRQWLLLEKNRPHFEIKATEISHEITLNKLTFKVRIDRIDEISPNQYLLIDYKTNDNKQWSDFFSERPDEPQLPLYALLYTESIGVSFAQVVPGEPSFKGLISYEFNINGIKPLQKFNHRLNWQTQKQEWQRILIQLSDQFYHGKVIANPKDPHTCPDCQFKPLCRRLEEETSG